MSKRKKTKKKNKEDQLPIAIVSLLINILLMPGLGSIIGRKIKTGVWQLILLFGSIAIGVSLILTIVNAIAGVLILIIGVLAAWLWGLITGIFLIQEASE